MAFSDSIDKIFSAYISAITKVDIAYKGKVWSPKVLRVSEGIFRDYTCPAGCGGCCYRHSLDWLPIEAHPEGLPLKERQIVFGTSNDPEFIQAHSPTIVSYLNDDHDDHWCSALRKEDGRCSIHGVHPFSCDFELVRFMHSSDRARRNNVTTRLFGRGWAMKRVDGEKGAQCTIEPVTDHSVAEVVRKFKRLRDWVSHFRIDTCIDEIIQWLEEGPHSGPGFFNTEFSVPKGASIFE